MRSRGKFIVGRFIRDAEHAKCKLQYRVRMEKCIIFALVLLIAVFILSKKIDRRKKNNSYTLRYSFISMDLPPATKSGSLPRPPVLPQIPIPSEDEFIPEDETIDFTDLDLNEGISLFDGTDDFQGEFGAVGGSPRPIREVIPEYPEDLRKKGVEGVIVLSILVNAQGKVDSVYVLNNSSGNKRLEMSAKAAALKSLYAPAKSKGKNMAYWISRPYTFERK